MLQTIWVRTKACTTIITHPASDPNSGPATVQIFSLQGAYRYAFEISAAYTSKSFKPAMVKANHTLSLNTTDEYVIDAVATVL